MKKLIIIPIILSLAASCAPQSGEDGKLNVFTSFYVMEDFVKEIGGDKVSVTNLTGAGEPHDFEISASQMAMLCKSDLFVYCGGVDSWADDISVSAAAEGCYIIKTTDIVDSALINPENADDSHIWLDPDIAIVQMREVCNALCAEDPENKAYYEENLSNAEEKYLSLKSDIEALRTKTDGKTIITTHGAYGYLCSELGLTQLAIEGIHGDSDPTASQIASVIDFAKENNIKYIFTSPNESSKSASAVAAETNAQIVYLDSMEADNGNGGYFDIMDKNITEIQKILTD